MSSSDRVLFLNGGYLYNNNQKYMEYSNYCVLNNTVTLSPNTEYNINPSYFKIYDASNDDLYTLDSSGLHFKIPSIMVITDTYGNLSSIKGSIGFIWNGSISSRSITISDDEFDSTGLCVPKYRGINVFNALRVSKKVSVSNNVGKLHLRIFQLL